MHGPRRIITFCILTTVLPTILIVIPLYLRHNIYKDALYTVAESDVLEIGDKISTVFCQQHTLRMNASFNAYQISGSPQMSKYKKHMRLTKFITLPDDTFEYWGFYLLKDSTVALKTCSRYQGSRILIVKGERKLNTCGLLDQHTIKAETHISTDYGQVKVMYEQQSHEITNSNHHKTVTNIGIVDNKNIKNPFIQEIKEDENLGILEKIAIAHISKHISKDSNNGTVDNNEVLTNISHNITDNTEKEIKDTEKNTSSHKLRFHTVDINLTPLDKLEVNKSKAQNFTINSNEAIIKDNIIPAKHKKRHAHKYDRIPKFTKRTKRSNGYINKREKERLILEKLLNKDVENERFREDFEITSAHLLDHGIEHGGNAANYTENESSVSSFENDLHTCFDGNILQIIKLPSNKNCTTTIHKVKSDGYYYYIFYSDNDLVSNDISAVFDIHKSTYQYANYSDTKKCINVTNCTFPISFLSAEQVIVEVPTHDGIEHKDNSTILISTCQPRMGIYILFPITVLFLILACAFL